MLMKERSKDIGAAEEEQARPRPAPRARTQRKHATLGPLAAYVGYALRRAQLAVFDDFFHTFEDVGLRPAEFGLMVVIDHNPGLKQAEASAILGIRTPNFVALVDGLERRGLAQRRKVENDRRSHALYLTPAGEALLKTVTARQAEHEARMTARLGKGGREQLLMLLDKLARDPVS